MFDEEITTPLPEDSERPEVIFTEGRVVYDGHTFDPALWADKYNTHVLCVFHMKIPRNDGWEQGFMPSIKIAYQPNAPILNVPSLNSFFVEVALHASAIGHSFRACLTGTLAP